MSLLMGPQAPSTPMNTAERRCSTASSARRELFSALTECLSIVCRRSQLELRMGCSEWVGVPTISSGRLLQLHESLPVKPLLQLHESLPVKPCASLPPWLPSFVP
ncbi:hypothetical protein Tcan_13805 [Toxocara canis]|uniref:Uncharacterized protein n=2 Tax=Toxocara canis TaxID=6265 RepID=A0A0B2VPR3_TOXCA|nr:hypothetical protein Tcan_13805 [Toxocara canis]VDM40928.1 unnamed protein product [Toxocara canis]